jgi:thymidylate kinase
MLKTIITISGLARAGKDTFAELLKEEFVCMGLKPLQINNETGLKPLQKDCMENIVSMTKKIIVKTYKS